MNLYVNVCLHGRGATAGWLYGLQHLSGMKLSHNQKVVGSNPGAAKHGGVSPKNEINLYGTTELIETEEYDVTMTIISAYIQNVLRIFFIP